MRGNSVRQRIEGDGEETVAIPILSYPYRGVQVVPTADPSGSQHFTKTGLRTLFTLGVAYPVPRARNL
jgi:hypothetical protein